MSTMYCTHECVRYLPPRAETSCLYVHQIRWIVAGVTRVAIFMVIVAYGFPQRTKRQIPQRIGFHETANLLDALIGGDQFAASGAYPRR